MAELDLNDTAGFYKYEGGILSWGKWVLNLNYELYADKREEYNLPVQGWYWFDIIDDARAFFGIPAPENKESDQ